jgi:hypothetical protein
MDTYLGHPIVFRDNPEPQKEWLMVDMETVLRYDIGKVLGQIRDSERGVGLTRSKCLRSSGLDRV